MSPPLHDSEIIASVMDDLPVAVWVARAPGGEFVYANRMFGEIMGTAGLADVALGEYAGPYGIHTRTGELYPEERMPFVLALEERRVVTLDDIVIHRHDGRKVNVRAEARPCFAASGELTHVVIAFIDISREVAMEEARAESEHRLRQAQKMESVGNLAGGIAHDFNNILAIIQVIASTLRQREADATKRSWLEQIEQATASAAELTRSVLGFARRGKNRSEPVPLRELITTVAELVRRGLDRRIEVVLELDAAERDPVGDRSQLEQVLMNLAVNARDAMPGGGTLTFRTRELDVDTDTARALELAGPGTYVELEVSDTGVGIEPAIRDRIFEPYFTTKTTGQKRGTGLGLATVFGIVQSHGGAIEPLEAAFGGTTMRVVLPAADAQERPRPARASPVPLPAGAGTILVVDDEPLVLAGLGLALTELGYTPLSAGSGEEAMALFRERRKEIVAVVLDMVMPGMSGRETYLALRELEPNVRVLLTTGHAVNEEAQGIIDLGVSGFLSKPYSVGALAHELDRILGEPNA